MNEMPNSMISLKHKSKVGKSGFIALIPVLFLSLSAIFFATSVFQNVFDYSDMLMRQEMRIQGQNNVRSCLDTMTTRVSKDYFADGTTSLPEFGCEANVVHINPSAVRLFLTVVFGLVTMKAGREMILNDSSVSILSDYIY